MPHARQDRGARQHQVPARRQEMTDRLVCVGPLERRLYYTVRVHQFSRRDVVKGVAAVGAATGLGLAAHGTLFERHALEITHVSLRVRDLAPALDGLRVGFLTDIHLSEIVPAADVARAVRMLNAEQPDLVVLGGDYVSFTDRSFMGPAADLLGGLSAPHGVFAIIGNHDDEKVLPSALRRQHIEPLLDQRTSLSIRGEQLTLAGLKFWTKRPDAVAEVVGTDRRNGPTLLIAHDPRRIVEAASLGVGGVLAGHTHGGQIVLPLIGAFAARKFPVASGLLKRDQTAMFVSRGVGTVIVPCRINCPPEVAVITLRTGA